MFKSVRAVVLVALASALSGCARPAAIPDAADASWAGERWPGTTLADLQSGRTMFVSRCSSCHNLPDPKSKDATAWGTALNEMAPRAKLTDEDRGRVMRYLSTMSARPERAGG